MTCLNRSSKKTIFILGDLGDRLQDTLDLCTLSVAQTTVIEAIINQFDLSEYEFHLAGVEGLLEAEHLIQSMFPKIQLKVHRLRREVQGYQLGLAQALLLSEKYLTGPFFCFDLNELVFSHQEIEGLSSKIRNETNWLGVVNRPRSLQGKLRNIMLKGNRVFEVGPTGQLKDVPFYQGYAGFFHVFDSQLFFQGLRSSNLDYPEVFCGLDNLLKLSVLYPFVLQWDRVSLYGILENRETPPMPIKLVQSKLLYFQIYQEQAEAEMAHLKTYIKPYLYPHNINRVGRLLSFKKIPAKRDRSLSEGLEFLQKFWWGRPFHYPEKEFYRLCKKTYFTDTMRDYQTVLGRYQFAQDTFWVNGFKLESFKDVIERLNWDKILNGVCGYYHGSIKLSDLLQSNEKGECLLKNWSSSFGGELEIGDVYWDLATIYRQIVFSEKDLSRPILKFQTFERVSLAIPRLRSKRWLQEFIGFVHENQLDIKIIKQIACLQLVQTAKYYGGPLDLQLIVLARLSLAKNRDHIGIKADGKGQVS
jgi:hypothetical protein